MFSFRYLLFIVTFAFAISGCGVTLPPDTVAATPKHPVVLSRYFSHTDRPLRGKSAYYPLSHPADALAARLFLIDHAVNTLDVQYYIYENDTVGTLISAHLYTAAQRGVRIRILLDDISTAGKDQSLSTLAAHPNITLHFFNPNKLRRAFRNVALLLNIDRLGKRMHNKALIADNTVAVIGGRNIGDVYFAKDDTTLFLDYDILAVGSVVPQLTRAFERYFNSPTAESSDRILDVPPHTVQESRRRRFIETFHQSPLGKAVARSDFMRKLRRDRLILTVADKSFLYYDDPRKVLTPEEDNRYHISAQVDETLKKVRRELLIVSPYFIPDATFLENLRRLHRRGVRITVMTNSLASTDVFPVYSGYKRYIKALLEAGVKLYELKPDSLRYLPGNLPLTQTPHTSLHTKMMIIDDDRLIVGSANIDPRSDKLNTELVLFIVSRKLATYHKQRLFKARNLRYLYRVTWEEYPFKQRGNIRKGPVWTTLEHGKKIRYYAPPHTGFFKRLLTDLTALLPIEGYL